MQDESATVPAPEANAPALVVVFGDTPGKRRPLARGSNIIGRARGCDIGLEANSVSTIHAVITRTASQILLRDCDSRTGSIVNGAKVRETVLHHGDVVQIARFTFEVDIPGASKPAEGDEGPALLRELNRRLTRLEGARRRSAQRAWKLRKQMVFMADRLAAAEARLRESGFDSESSISQLGDLQRIQMPDDESESLRRENELLTRKLGEFNQHRQELQQLLDEARSQPPIVAAPVDDAAVAERDQLRAELEETKARHAEEIAGFQTQIEQEVGRIQKELVRERDKLRQDLSEKNRLLNELQEGVGQEIARIQEEIGGERDRLRRQLETEREQFDAQITAFREAAAANESAGAGGEDSPEMQQKLEKQRVENESRLNALREELNREKQRLKDFVKQAAMQHDSTRKEITQLREQLAAAATGEAIPMPTGLSAEEAAAFEAEIERLRTEVADKQRQLESQQRAMPEEVMAYESQLNEFREQLEQAQEQLVGEEKELKEKIRTTEMQLSKERAEIARERSLLERTRNELRSELDHAKREAESRQHLAPLKQLQDEMKNQERAADEQDNSTLAGRIRGLLRRLGDG